MHQLHELIPLKIYMSARILIADDIDRNNSKETIGYNYALLLTTCFNGEIVDMTCCNPRKSLQSQSLMIINQNRKHDKCFHEVLNKFLLIITLRRRFMGMTFASGNQVQCPIG